MQPTYLDFRQCHEDIDQGKMAHFQIKELMVIGATTTEQNSLYGKCKRLTWNSADVDETVAGASPAGDLSFNSLY